MPEERAVRIRVELTADDAALRRLVQDIMEKLGRATRAVGTKAVKQFTEPVEKHVEELATGVAQTMERTRRRVQAEVAKTRRSMNSLETTIIDSLMATSQFLASLGAMGAALARWGYFRVFHEIARGLAEPELRYRDVLSQIVEQYGSIDEFLRVMREKYGSLERARVEDPMYMMYEEVVNSNRFLRLMAFNMAKLIFVMIGTYAFVRAIAGDVFSISGYMQAGMSLLRTSMMLIFKPMVDALGIIATVIGQTLLPLASGIYSVLEGLIVWISGIESPVARFGLASAFLAFMVGLPKLVYWLIRRMISSIGGALAGIVRETIGDRLSSVVDDIASSIRNGIDNIVSSFKNAIDDVVSSLSGLDDSLKNLSKTATQVADDVAKGAGKGIGVSAGESLARGGLRALAFRSLRGFVKGGIVGIVSDLILSAIGYMIAGETGAKWARVVSWTLGGAAVGSAFGGIGALPGALLGAGIGILVEVVGVRQAISELGKMLDWLSEKVFGVGDSLKKFGTWVGSSVERIVSMFTSVSTLKGLFESLANPVDTLVGLFESLVDAVSGLLEKIGSAIGLGSRQIGGYVPTTGLYYLHAGEYVVPRSGAVPGASIVNVNIYVDGSSDPEAVAEIVLRRVEDVFRQYGVGF